ncbi:MAG TPA: DUF928 domain-containing protein [Nitrospiraceae bacterium]|nr:DUF928 domain-containing protein [Nitrospiraceae bacterium]
MALPDEQPIDETPVVAGTGPGAPDRQHVTALDQTHQLPAADVPTLISLVPNHVGLTIADQPVVYWYLSRPTQARTLFVLLDARSLQVVRSIALPPSERAGIHSMRFKDYGVTLQRDVPYRWFVNLLIDPATPDRDLVASGAIERIDPEFPQAKVPSASSLDAVHFYADQGLWYDAMAAISDLIAAAPLNDVFRQQRASLLQQVGLQEVAEWDLRHRQMD